MIDEEEGGCGRQKRTWENKSKMEKKSVRKEKRNAGEEKRNASEEKTNMGPRMHMP